MILTMLLLAYIAAACGLLVYLIADREGLGEDDEPLPWWWVLCLAIFWPVVCVELLAGEPPADGHTDQQPEEP
jgi:hypothetical protein